jgi:aromatic-L-amino-acid decarboxylase
VSAFGTLEEAARAIALAGERAGAFRRDVDDLPAAVVLSDEERARYRVPLPRTGAGLEATIEHVAGEVLPRSLAHSHPRAFAFIDGSGLEAGVAAAVLAAALDANLGGAAGAASELEDAAWRWLAELIDFPAAAGHFTSGGTHANLTGLACARARALPAAREHGVAPGSVAVYASEQAHNSIARACDVLGFGRRALRTIRCDESFRVRPDELARAIETDRAAGVTPVAVVGAAGTTSTGAVDPLDALADICAQHGVWMHVDGAYGAPAAAAPTSAPLFRGLARADSLAIDPHKWLYLPKAVGCVLLRDGGVLADAFADEAAYLENVGDGPYGGPVWPVWEGIEVTHPFRGLGPWMALAAYGADALVGAIENDLRLTRLLADAVRAAPDLELLDEPQLSIVVYRHHPTGLDDAAALDAHNRELLDAMQRDGRVLLSGTTVLGAFALRPCMTHHRSSDADVLALAEVASELGGALAAPQSPTRYLHGS